ncbi:hypothetical protein [Longispora urticae]
MTSVLTRSRFAALALAGAATLAAVAVPTAASAAVPNHCFYNVTAAGVGQPVRSAPSLSASVVGSLGGSPVITHNYTWTRDNIVWSADFYVANRVYPLRNLATGVVYAAKDHCENSNS